MKATPNPTIYDVAQKAGVSIATVSRVLNNRAAIPAETRQKVQRAAEELNFKANSIARGLVTRRSNLVEVCFAWSSPRINLANEWYTGLLDGFYAIAQERQYGLLVNTISGVYDAQEVYRRATQNTVDGILMVSPYLTPEAMNKVKDYPLPVVLVGCRAEGTSLDYVDSGNAKAAEEVVEFLAKKGHRKIACITGEVEISSNAADRLEGFKRGMKKRKFPVPASYIQGGDFGWGSGAQAMRKLLALKERPTAVFACNDQMALGAWETAEKEGVKVGKKLALVGFDDIPQAASTSNPLTTVRQDFQALSTQAARLLLEKIEHSGHWEPRQMVVPTKLVVRKSSGA